VPQNASTMGRIYNQWVHTAHTIQTATYRGNAPEAQTHPKWSYRLQTMVTQQEIGIGLLDEITVSL